MYIFATLTWQSPGTGMVWWYVLLQIPNVLCTGCHLRPAKGCAVFHNVYWRSIWWIPGNSFWLQVTLLWDSTLHFSKYEHQILSLWTVWCIYCTLNWPKITESSGYNLIIGLYFQHKILSTMTGVLENIQTKRFSEQVTVVTSGKKLVRFTSLV